MVKIGILSFAHLHANSYAECIKNIPAGELTGIYDDNPDRGNKVATKYGCKFFPELNDLLATDINAVIICAENVRHKDLVLSSAKAGKHILCEKPISTTIQDGLTMIESSKKYGIKMMTAFPCRYSPAIKRLYDLLKQDYFGKILAFYGTNRGQLPRQYGEWFVTRPLSGGGAVIDHTVHVVDLMYWLLAGTENRFIPVKKVYAEIDRRFYDDIDVDDCGIITLTFNNGTIASLDPSWSRPLKSYPTWGDVTLKIVGEKGIAELDMFNQKCILYNEDTVHTQWINWGDNIDMLMLTDFINSVEKDLPVNITGEDGLRAVEVALAAYTSAGKGEPVFLPEK